MNKVWNTIKSNKILVALIVLLLVAGIYIGALALHDQDQDGNANATNGSYQGQQVIITDSNGFSVNGDVVIQQGGVTTVEQGTSTGVAVNNNPAYTEEVESAAAPAKTDYAK